MNLDIRIPIGLLLAIIGGLLGVFGLLTFQDKALYQRSLGYNINIGWGAIMLVAGLIMIRFGRRGSRGSSTEAAPPPVDTSTH